MQEWHGVSSLCGHLLPGPTIILVCLCSCQWRPTASCQSPCRFFSSLTVFTAASSLGTSCRSATVFFLQDLPPNPWCPFCSTFPRRHPLVQL
jgi:hypothetical protein